MTKKHIAKKYAALLNDVATKDYYTKVDLTNRVNCYKCDDCKRITKTKDVDAGVTPMFHRCETCGGRAVSSFYRDVAPIQKPTEEWYRPSLEELLKMDDYLQQHVLSGGLTFRKIKQS